MKKILWLIPIAAFAAMVYWAWQAQDSLVAGKMPDCAAAPIKKLLRQAIEDAPGNKAAQIKVLDAVDFAAVPGSSDEHRICTAIVFSNAGKETVKFSLEWMTAAKDRIWLQTVP